MVRGEITGTEGNPSKMRLKPGDKSKKPNAKKLRSREKRMDIKKKKRKPGG